MTPRFQARDGRGRGRVCGTRHGLYRSLVTASAQVSAAGRADLGAEAFQHACLECVQPHASAAVAQRDLPHRAAADAVDAGEQLDLPCPPQQPSWRIRSRMSRISMPRCAEYASLNMRSGPQRSQVMHINQPGKVANGSSSASVPVGSGSLP
jgi:hypothetical protein